MPSRRELESEAERAVRRGDLKEALRLYGSLLEQAPDDRALRARLEAIRSVLQPSELTRAAAPPGPRPRLERPPTPEQTAEMLFERGDYEGALAAWGRILAARPDHQLARERYEEVRTLAASIPRRAEPPLPRDRSGIYEALLARIASRRRS